MATRLYRGPAYQPPPLSAEGRALLEEMRAARPPVELLPAARCGLPDCGQWGELAYGMVRCGCGAVRRPKED